MKKPQLNFFLFFTLFLFLAANISAQEFHIEEGFADGNTPAGWSSEGVSDTNVSANETFPDSKRGRKMKTDKGDSWLQMPQVFGASDLTFWCRVRDLALKGQLKIQVSTDGNTWIDHATNPAGLNLESIDVWQKVIVPINIEGAVYIRFYVSSETPGTSATGTFIIDDIQLGKLASASDDVFLTSIAIGGVALEGFDLNTKNYSVVIPYLQNYAVEAVANNPNATLAITQVSNIKGAESERTVTIVVTGEDGITTATTTVVITRADYFYKEGFVSGVTGLSDWERSGLFQPKSGSFAGSPNLYDGDQAIRFTKNDGTSTLISPELINVGTLKFWTAVQASFEGQSLKVFIVKGEENTEIISLDNNALSTTWQEVVVEINETTDRIRIRIEAISNIGDDPESRVWLDDLLLTVYEGEGSETGILDVEARKVEFYPNPVKDILNIQVVEDTYQSFEIYNLSGQKVKENTIMPHQKTINLESLANGVYVISFTGKAGTYNTKLIKK